jgi:hypothetical protein
LRDWGAHIPHSSSRSHLLDTNWLTVGVSEQVIGIGAEADGLTAGAGLAMTTAGWGPAGVGWMGCTYEKRDKPLLPTTQLRGLGPWVDERQDRDTHEILTYPPHSHLCPTKKARLEVAYNTSPMIMTS